MRTRPVADAAIEHRAHLPRTSATGTCPGTFPVTSPPPSRRCRRPASRWLPAWQRRSSPGRSRSIARRSSASVRKGPTDSKAVAYFDHFVTVVGPRLTGSPAHKAAADWAREQLAAAGLSNAHLEPFEFGRGWELTGFTLEMTSPRYMPLIGYPEAWSAPTDGVLEGTPLFIGDKSGGRDRAAQAAPQRRHRPEPADADRVRPGRSRASRAPRRRRSRIGAPPMPGTRRSQDDTRRITQALREAGAGVLLRPSAGEHGTMFVLGRDAGANAMPSVVLAAEHYNMIARMIAAGVPVTLRVKVGSRYLREPTRTATT